MASAGDPEVAPTAYREYRFRPDLQGLRAVALFVVVLGDAFHFPRGGFVGIDVFFVIAGFLATSALLHESEQRRVAITAYFARRAGRIVPVTALTVIATVLATYHLLGFLAGNAAATTGKWSMILAANIHFGIAGTDHPGSALPPSPLQSMWPVAVAAQFLAIWLVAFIVVAANATTVLQRRILASVLAGIIALSLIWAVIQTGASPVWAYFSPLSRAFELAAGALLAVWAPTIAQIVRNRRAQILAVGGTLIIVASAIAMTPGMPYPGVAAVVPVLGSASVIAAGCGADDTTMGWLLAARPLRWIGVRSYSIYLWHWPLLVLPAEFTGGELLPWQAAGLVLAAFAVSAASYRLVERPIRNSVILKNHPKLTLSLGVALVVLTIVFAQWQISKHYGTWDVFVNAG